MIRFPTGPEARTLKSKSALVALRLEHFLGVPERSGKLPAPLDMLIATVLSQNTNDKNSHRAYTRLRERYPSWKAVAAAPGRSVASAIRSGGMASQKSACIRQILGEVHGRFGRYSLNPLRDWPTSEVFDLLTRMKGVGPKTASCVILFSLGRDFFPVDTHIHRICGRLGLTPEARTPEETFVMMRRIFPSGKAYTFHTNLIRFGRRVCRSARPLCGDCPLHDLCPWKEKTGLSRATSSGADHDFMLLDNVNT